MDQDMARSDTIKRAIEAQERRLVELVGSQSLTLRGSEISECRARIRQLQTMLEGRD